MDQRDSSEFGVMSSELGTKTKKLKEIFQSMKRVVVAFSGGVDSTLLL